MFSTAVMTSDYCEMYAECYYFVIVWPKYKENYVKNKYEVWLKRKKLYIYIYIGDNLCHKIILFKLCIYFLI